VTYTVLTGEGEEELTLEKRAAIAAALGTILVKFPKDLLVSDGPGDSGHGNSEQEEPDHLVDKRHPKLRLERRLDVSRHVGSPGCSW
jgi:hypothetical protein